MIEQKNIYLGKMFGQDFAKQIGARKSGVNEFLKLFEECEAISYPLPNGITNYEIAEQMYDGVWKHPGTTARTPTSNILITRI